MAEIPDYMARVSGKFNGWGGATVRFAIDPPRGRVYTEDRTIAIGDASATLLPDGTMPPLDLYGYGENTSPTKFTYTMTVRSKGGRVLLSRPVLIEAGKEYTVQTLEDAERHLKYEWQVSGIPTTGTPSGGSLPTYITNTITVDNITDPFVGLPPIEYETKDDVVVDFSAQIYGTFPDVSAELSALVPVKLGGNALGAAGHIPVSYGHTSTGGTVSCKYVASPSDGVVEIMPMLIFEEATKPSSLMIVVAYTFYPVA